VSQGFHAPLNSEFPSRTSQPSKVRDKIPGAFSDRIV
jgi:hypothetical protein